MKQKQSRRYFTEIDGLRALAVIGVILYHINPNQFIGGYLGVLIFFCSVRIFYNRAYHQKS
ncbi:hypothetical protein [Holzapfeliella floricola]|uniref:hypothetical protein n=1 Tax=Holzapfeliella floricola TaxID=679249 RepID=UPI0007805CEE|nr:hypothetical protein [Holzapfeliella floricola]